MRKYVGYLLILVFIAISFFHCSHPYEKIDQEKTRIVLVHPHVSYLKSFIYLIENKIIDIPDLELIGVIYTRADNDSDNLKEFLEESDYPYVHLQKIDGDLNQDNLFQENSCSKNFYKMFKDTDGILFLGGDDLPPSIYEQKTSLLTDIRNPHRHYFELSFLFHLLGGRQNNNFQPYLEENPNYVVYGFCLGLQTMNVATGGTLYQDIPHEIYGLEYVEDVLNLEQDLQHKNYWRNLFADDDLMSDNFHRIQLLEDQFFIKELKLSSGEHPLVCSCHHQAIEKLGKGFKVIATSIDGKVIEAIAHEKYKNVIGTQFHPEAFDLYSPEGKKYKRAPDDTELLSNHEILENQRSLQFHQKFWEYFSKLFSETKKTNKKTVSN